MLKVRRWQEVARWGWGAVPHFNHRDNHLHLTGATVRSKGTHDAGTGPGTQEVFSESF